MLKDKALALQFAQELKALFDKYEAERITRNENDLTIVGSFGTIDDIDITTGTIWSEQPCGWALIKE